MMRNVSTRTYRVRRSVGMLILLVLVQICIVALSVTTSAPTTDPLPETGVLAEQTGSTMRASEALETLAVKGRAPKTGYSRAEFGDGWATIAGCDVRNTVLARAMEQVVYGSDNCVVLSGILQDPYTGKTISFVRGTTTSDAVQIDHVVALSDAWQKGAQGLNASQRVALANDALNLLAVDGPANQEKGDSDAASWLPPRKEFRCQYVARQIAVKKKYGLWVSAAEKATMRRIINGCGEQALPVEM